MSHVQKRVKALREWKTSNRIVHIYKPKTI